MSTTYSITRDQIIVASLRKLGQVEPEDDATTVNATLITNAAVVFNLMIKQMMTQGIKVWTITELTLPLVASQTSYVIGPTGPDLTTDKPLKLIQAFLRNKALTPNVDIPLQLLSKQEYNTLGSKFSTGTANSVYLDVGVTSSTLKVYLTPDTLAVSTYEIHLVVQKPISDANSGTDVPEFPSEWYNVLVWGLSDELAIEYDVPANHRQEIAIRAKAYREMLEDWDTEYTSTFFQPEMRMSK